MADYNMTYEDIKNLVEQHIEQAEDNENLKEHTSEILAALTYGNFDDSTSTDKKSVEDMIHLWDNQIVKPSQFLLGTHYIRIKDSMLSFIVTALTSGFVDEVIKSYIDPSTAPIVISIAAATGIVVVLWKIFKSASELDDWDFCVYMQAVCHFREHKSFSENDLRDWLPHGDSPRCNMHGTKWDCEHLDKDDNCIMMQDNRLKMAINSLMNKNVLEYIIEDGKELYKFKV